MTRLTVPTVLFASVFVWVAPPPDLGTARARAILDARVVCLKMPHQSGAEWSAAERKLETLLWNLFRDEKSSADEAMVILLNYYLGEANGEDLLHQVTVRGKRMLPLLRKYRRLSPPCQQIGDPPGLVLPVEVKRREFKTAIDYISRDRIWGED
jgi:hypothetical protein